MIKRKPKDPSTKRNLDKDRYEVLRVRVAALEKDVQKIKEKIAMKSDEGSYQDITGDGV